MMRYSEKITAGVFETLFKLLGFFPRTWTARMADFLGGMLFCVDKKHRGIVMDNLTYAFGHEKQPEEIKKIARQVFINLVKVVFEIGWSLKLDERCLAKYFKIDGFRHMKKAYKKGKGVLVLTAHCGNWEFLAVAGSMIEYPVSMVVRPLDFKPLDRFLSI